MRMLLERQVEGRGAVVIAGEPGTLRRRLLRHALADLVARDEIVWVDDIDRLAPSAQGDLLEQARAGLRIAATATPGFKHGMRDGSLRSDLYYSIGGSPVTTVPLRMRPDDVDRLMAAAGVTAITEDAMARLRAYEWPGNLRELELVAEHARVLAGNGVVADEHVMVPAGAAQDAADAFVLRIPSAGMALEAVEREAIRQTLEASDSNVAEAARRLAIERGKLRYRLRRYGLGR
jgi:DNA-binding NtrC family response regulator